MKPDTKLLSLLSHHVFDGVATEEEKAICRRILFYTSPPEKAECRGSILILGNPRECVDRAPLALALYRSCPGSRLVPSGGVLIPGSDKTESLAMRDFFLESGVPESDILSENRSRTTIENFAFSAEIVNGTGLDTLYLVTSSYHMRRSVLYFKSAEKSYRTSSLIPCPSDFPGCSESDWYDSESGRRSAATELRLLAEHINAGIIQGFSF